MKLRGIYEEEMIGNENVMVSLDNKVLNGIIRTNETATFILSLLKNETTTDEIVDKLIDKYGIDYSTAQGAVNKVLIELRKLNLIEE